MKVASFNFHSTNFCYICFLAFCMYLSRTLMCCLLTSCTRYDPIDLENLDPDSEAFCNHQSHLRRTSMKRPVVTSSIAADAEHGDRNVDSSSRGAPRRKVKSPLPDNYPRIPLNDITAVLYADSNVSLTTFAHCAVRFFHMFTYTEFTHVMGKLNT